jgi:hypothetical protein
MTEQTPDPAAAGAKPADVKPTGTASAPNPKTGSSDAARGLGGHSKDADHKPGAPAEYVEDGKPVEKA